MRRPLALSFAAALAATAAVWGVWLSPRWTIDASAQEVGIHPRCRASGPRLACAEPYSQRWSVDPGATCWQELPTDSFFHEALRRGEGRPAWNPYVGSGFPVVFDGVHSRGSPVRALLARFPGPGGRDLLVFLRMLAWTWGIALAVALLGCPWVLVALAALAAALAPYPAAYIDIIFLDVDLLAPWFAALLIAFVLGRLSLVPAAALAFGLGLLVGLLGFLQSQFVFAAAAGVLALAAIPATRGRSLLLAGAAGLGLAAAAPNYLPMIGHLQWFSSGRDLQCVADDGLGLRGLLGRLFAPPAGLAAPDLMAGGAGVLLMAATVRRARPGFLLAAFVLLAAWAALGAPAWLCSLPGISGVRFWRHLLPYVQALFVVVTALAIDAAARARLSWRALLAILALGAAVVAANGAPGFWRARLLAFALLGGALALSSLVISSLSRDSRASISADPGDWAPGAARRSGPPGVEAPGTWQRRLARLGPALPVLFCLGLGLCAYPPFFLSNTYLASFRWWGPPRQLPPVPAALDRDTPLGAVAELSRRQDRRHYGLGYVLFPGWSAAFGILDLRMVEPFYPAGVHALNRGVFSHWLTLQPGFPDRFVRPDPESLTWDPGFQRVLALHRVSLLSFPSDFLLFPPAPSPWEQGRCRLLARDQGIESWLCPDVGGVGWFPRRVERARTVAGAVSRLAAAPLADVLETVIVGPEGADGPLAPAAGRVLGVERTGDRLAYRLAVERPGVFVVADAFFPGWKARVAGAPAPVLRANAAFKAVRVPRGEIEVELRFEPGWWSPPPPR